MTGNRSSLPSPDLVPEFAALLSQWQRLSGRNDLPWQVSDPYLIWVSEIMLQQTQVKTVLHYFPRFIASFPTVNTLAKASLEEVLQQWAGLGYYARARNLHASAQFIVQHYPEQFPRARLEWQALKGIGRSTAAAIVVFAFQQREAILDGNVKRILARVFLLPFNIAASAHEKTLWNLAEQLLPENNADMPAYTQGLMDLGATICTKQRPLCEKCPISQLCQAHNQQKTNQFPIQHKRITIKKISLFWPVVLNQHQKILLTERSHTGIWPGLLCPPCFDSKDAMLAWLSAYDYQELSALPVIKHKLTHRELSIYPFEIKILTENCASFYALEQAIQERIPKPLKTLIMQHYLQNN